MCASGWWESHAGGYVNPATVVSVYPQSLGGGLWAVIADQEIAGTEQESRLTGTYNSEAEALEVCKFIVQGIDTSTLV